MVPRSPPSLSEPPRPSTIGAARAQIIAWTGIGLINLVVVDARWSLGNRGIAGRALQNAFELGQAIALGLVSAALVAGWGRTKRALFPRLSPTAAWEIDLAALAAVSWALAYPILGEDLSNRAFRLADTYQLPAPLFQAGLVLGVAAGIPVVGFLGRVFARPRLRWLALGAAVVNVVSTHFTLTIDYPGGHFYQAWASAIFAGASIATMADEGGATPARVLGRRALSLAGALLAAWSVLVRPPDAVLVSMLKPRGTTIAPFLARVRAARPASTVPAKIPPALAPWFADRSHAPDVPPSAPAARPDPIIILFTVDALRGDVIDSGKHDAVLPELLAMKQEGTLFTEARSPGSATVFSLSALFMGKYFSDQYWTNKGEIYPWQDESPRFPELLAARGVPTVSFVSRMFMLDAFGVARGFEEESFVRPRRGSNTNVPTGRQLVDGAIARLRKHDQGPLFLWIHDMDAHAPYDLGGTEGSLYERYVREVSVVDRDLHRLRAFLRGKGWQDRATIIVSADHGDAFGEHGTWDHAGSVYDELLHIPLLVVGPGVKPHTDATPVALVDVGPTILDLMGIPTPGTWMGQSLAPLLRGEPADLTRPIVAETRLKQTIILPSGLKLIRNQREGTREIYDLNKDPGEERSLIDVPSADPEAQMSILSAFFAEHTLKRPGYTPPYRPW